MRIYKTGVFRSLIRLTRASAFTLVFVYLFLGLLPNLLSDPLANVYPPTINQSFFERKDILYSSEIGSWMMQDGRFDGHFMFNYKNSCPNCSNLSKNAYIPVVRWSVWDTFPDIISPRNGQPGRLRYDQFNNVIDGIRNDLNAYPLIKLQPIDKTPFCPDVWGVDNLMKLNKTVIKTADNRVQLYEIANEPDWQCNWKLSDPGIKLGNYWIQMVPELKKFSRSLGFEIYIGGPSFIPFDPIYSKKLVNDFLLTIRNEYDNSSSPNFHNKDLIPDFINWHAYGSYSKQLIFDEIGKQAATIDNIKILINQYWGDINPPIKLVISEYNVHSNGITVTDADMVKWFNDFLLMLRSKDVFMANQFLMGSVAGNQMDLVTTTGQPGVMYGIFKQLSSTDTQAITSRNKYTTRGDYNYDGVVNLTDYNLLKSNFNKPFNIHDYNDVVKNYKP